MKVFAGAVVLIAFLGVAAYWFLFRPVVSRMAIRAKMLRTSNKIMPAPTISTRRRSRAAKPHVAVVR